MRAITVVLPTQNELKTSWIQKILPQICNFPNFEVIVVDNSTDGTKEFLNQFSVKVIHSQTNTRAEKLNEGISVAKSDWILLHHPRSLISLAGLNCLSIEDLPEWGAFTHRFDLPHPLLRFTSWYSNHIRGDLNSIYYLDHCLFFHKKLIKSDLTPVPLVSIFEDTRFCMKLRKISKGRRLASPTHTSSLRFVKNGIYFQALINQLMKLGFYFGISDETLNKIYERGLSLNSKYK